MAVSFVTERVETVSTANASTYDSASFTPGINSLLILAVAAGDTAATYSISSITTVSGTTLTWNNIATGAEFNDGTTFCNRALYYAIAPSSTAATVIRVTWSEALVGCHIWIGEFAGFDPTSPITQSNATTLASGTETHSLASAVHPDSMTVYMNQVLRNPPAWDASGDSWDERMDNGSNTPAHGMFVATKANDQTIAFTGTNIQAGSIIAEIRPLVQATHVVLTTTPTLPVASVRVASIQHIIFTTTPTLPAAAVAQSLTHTVLSATPTLPAADVDNAGGTPADTNGLTETGVYVNAIVTETGERTYGTTTGITETGRFVFAMAEAEVGDTNVTHLVLTITPSLPAASVTHQLTHIVLTVTPSLPAANVGPGVTHVVLTTTPTFGTVSYESEVAADSPVVWWKMDDVSSPLEDYGSGTDSDIATATGTPAFGETSLITGGGTSVRFPSGNTASFGMSPPAELGFTGSFTFECWFKYTGSPASLGTIMSERFGDGDVRFALTFSNGGSDTLTPNFGWYNGSWRLATGAAASTDTVYHYVGVYDASGTPSLKLYVNGSLVDTETTLGTQPTSGSGDIQIGRRWDNSSNEYLGSTATCWVQHAAFYNSALDGTRVLAHYNAGIGGGGVRIDHSLLHQAFTTTPTLPAATIQSAQSVTHVVLTTTPTYPAAQVRHSLTHVVLTTTPTFPQAAVQMTSVNHVVLTVVPSLPVARLDHSLTHIVLTTTPTLPAAAVTFTQNVTHIVLTTTPSLPAAEVRAERTATHIVLTITPSLPVARLDHSVLHAVLTTTPSLPVSEIRHSLTHIVLTTVPSLPPASILAAQTVTHIVLTVTPSLPVAEVRAERTATHIVLTVTPSLPVAQINHAITHIVLTTVPTLPAASVTHSLTAIVLTVTPTFPIAQINHAITHLVLTITPTLPPATLQTANDLVHATITITPTLPAAVVQRQPVHVVLTITPTLPAAQINHSLTHVVLTTVPTLPAANVGPGVTHLVLTTTPTLPQATVRHSLTHIVLSVTPSLPAASLTQSLTHIVLSTTPTFPPASLLVALNVTHVVLTTVPTFPQASVRHSITHLVLSVTPTFPPATVTSTRTAFHIVLTITPTFPLAAVGPVAGHVVLAITPTFPPASVTLNVGHAVLAIVPEFPASVITAERTAEHIVLEITPVLPPAILITGRRPRNMSGTMIPLDGEDGPSGSMRDLSGQNTLVPVGGVSGVLSG